MDPRSDGLHLGGALMAVAARKQPLTAKDRMIAHRVSTAKRAEVRIDPFGEYAARIGDIADERGLDRGELYEEWCDRVTAHRFAQDCSIEDAERRALADVEASCA